MKPAPNKVKISAGDAVRAPKSGDVYTHLESGEEAVILSVDSSRVVTLRRISSISGYYRKPLAVGVVDLHTERVTAGGHERRSGYLFLYRPSDKPPACGEFRVAVLDEATLNSEGERVLHFSGDVRVGALRPGRSYEMVAKGDGEIVLRIKDED